MDWKNLLIQIAAFVVAALVAWVLAKVRSLISVKVKNEKARGFLTAALDAVSSAVKGTYQTYVESIKGTDAWTKDAQEKALHLALTSALEQLTGDVQKYITENYGNPETWLKQQIEATLYDLKNKPKEADNENP